MGWLWWTLGFGCGGLVLLAVAGCVVLAFLDNRQRARVHKQGEHTIGWLVEAHKNIFEAGVLDEAGVVVISPDPGTARDRYYMMELADRVFDLKGVDPNDCADEGETYIAALMADETYVEGKKDRLPKGFIGGRTVYLAHIMIFRDHLPGTKLSGRRVPCAVVWGDDRLPVCSRPVSAKDYRRPAEDGDEG